MWLQLVLAVVVVFPAQAVEPAPLLEDSVATCREWIQSRPFSERHTPRTRVLSAQVACFDGAVADDSLAGLHEWIAHVPANTQPLLVLRSSGGDVARALDLAQKLQDRQARVHVVDACASSCANYFYAGVQDRRVDDGALVLFHGGATESTLADLLRSLDAFLASPEGSVVSDPEASRAGIRAQHLQLRQRQDALYQAVGVSSLITDSISELIDGGLDRKSCGGADPAQVQFLYFGQSLAQRLGIAPALGRVEDQPERAADRVRALGEEIVVCRAPDAALDAALDADTSR